MRPRKKHNLDKRMQAAASFRVERPEENKGRWRALFGAPDDAPLHVELGCGKGTFVCESARRNPDICYIAFDKVPRGAGHGHGEGGRHGADQPALCAGGRGAA